MARREVDDEVIDLDAQAKQLFEHDIEQPEHEATINVPSSDAHAAMDTNTGFAAADTSAASKAAVTPPVDPVVRNAPSLASKEEMTPSVIVTPPADSVVHNASSLASKEEIIPSAMVTPPMDSVVPNAPSLSSNDDLEEIIPSTSSHGKASGDLSQKDGELTYCQVMRPYAERSEVCFAVGCAVHCLFLFIFIICYMSVGKPFLNFTTGAALHLWHEPWKLHADALNEGKKIASFDLSSQSAQAQQTMTRIPAGKNTYKLEIIYDAKDGNMLTTDKLKKAKELEDFVTNAAGYENYCLRAQKKTTCADPVTIIKSCVPAMCGLVQNAQGLPGPQPGCGPKSAKGMTPAANCLPAKSYPAGVFQCSVPSGCTRSQMTIDDVFLSQKVSAYSTAFFAVDFPETEFLASVDSQFGAGSTTASAIRTQFTFAFPLEGYSSVTDKPEEQKTKIEAFMKEAYFDKLNNYNYANPNDPFLIGFSGGQLSGTAISQLLNTDFSFVAFAFVVVYIYVMVMTGSIFYSTLALAQIFLSFFTGFLVYRIIFGSFFGTFHVMAIFLLLGIGVDDVFVFLDHFVAAIQVKEGYAHDLHARLSWTWKHATTAMGVTSLTTAVSFFMNAMSSFPGIAAFGIFAGTLVTVMYTSMCFFWPAVVAFNQKQFSAKEFLCGIPARINDTCLRNTSAEALEDEARAKEATKPLLVRFFEDSFSRFILKFRFLIVCIFTAVTIFMIVTISRRLTPEKEQPQMLPEVHPLNQYISLMRTKFVRGGGSFNTKVNLIFGFDHEPLDRAAADNTGAGYGASSDTIGTLGNVRWNPNFLSGSNLNNATVILGGFPCYIQLCDAAEGKSTDRKTGGPPAYGMKGCLPRDLKQYMQAEDPSGWSARWQRLVDGNVTEFSNTYFAKADSDPKWHTKMESYTYGEKVGDRVNWRLLRSELSLTSSSSIDYRDGIKVANAWEEWLKSEMDKGECAKVKNTFWPLLHAPHFAQFRVVEALLKEMTQGVMVSLAVALVVLVLATGNFIVGTVAAASIGMIVLWVMAMIPLLGWELGMIENIVLVMVPGLSVDFTAHLAEAYNQAKFDDREHRVVHALEHSGVSIVSGSISTSLAGLCLLFCNITFFTKFGTLLLYTIFFAVLFSLFFFPSVMALVGPTGDFGDWHKFIHRRFQRELDTPKKTRLKTARVCKKTMSTE
eukprot:TRINITY_DN6161_c0_g1_i1.p1 TRINITY_DN6161_c0_g1~~TRINITY_DN6161_c0_g1_i1.p1  ORF type:complete len:1184 (-),score=129.57 TRINITY_DN6161_c0_g1_i1:89-3640(-)